MQQYQQAQSIVGDDTTTATTLLKLNINLGNQSIETRLGSYFTEDTWTDTTVSGTSTYSLPDRFIRLKQIYVTVSNIRYNARLVESEVDWQRIRAYTNAVRSDILTHVFVRRDSYEIHPTPASSSNTITMIYEAGYKFLTQDDYTTGTITTLANGGTAVTASGSTFDATFAGRYFKINAYPIWYPISAYGTSTTLTLGKKYQGTAISAGSSAYTIGEFARTPSETHMLAVYFAVSQYYNTKKDQTNAQMYMNMFEKGLETAVATYGNRYSTAYIPSQKYLRIYGVRDPNNWPSDLT